MSSMRLIGNMLGSDMVRNFGLDLLLPGCHAHVRAGMSSGVQQCKRKRCVTTMASLSRKPGVSEILLSVGGKHYDRPIVTATHPAGRFLVRSPNLNNVVSMTSENTILVD